LPEILSNDVLLLRIVGSAVAANCAATWVAAAQSKHWANSRAVAQQSAADPPNRAVKPSRLIITERTTAAVHGGGVFCKDCTL